MKRPRGLTLIEVLLAMIVVSIAALGTTQFRYQAALDARRADVQILASRTALLLLESWRGNNGAAADNPVANLGSLIGIETSGSGPTLPGGSTLLNKYQITAGGLTFYATMSWKDPGANFRVLNVILAYHDRGQASSYSEMNKTIQITNYVNY